MSNIEISQTLKTVLADSYSLYLKTQCYHWNVTGQNFKSLHDLFELQYLELASAIDNIAERITTLGQRAPGSWKEYDNLTNIDTNNDKQNANEMLNDLASAYEIIIKNLNNSLNIAKKYNDEVTISILIDRILVHEKNLWMIKSSM